MAKKVYNHNDYYGYINKIQSKAISNPEWFWSDSTDAIEARQWLHDNNAGAIIDEIYNNTPENIRKKISYKKLTTNKAQETYNQGIRDTANKASKYVAGALAASAALPYTISAFPSIASEVAATAKFLATPAGKAAMSKLTSDMAVSTAVGEAVNESARLSGYNGFGDLVSQSVGVDPETKGYKYISGAADFLNPGYFIGGAAANRVWNAARLGAIESNNLTTQAIERNRMFREIVDNSKQRLSDTFRNLKSSIVKRVNRTKDGVTTEVPENVVRQEVPIEQIVHIVTEPENVIREQPGLIREPSLQNAGRRRIIEEATIPENIPAVTEPVNITVESPNWVPKEPTSVPDYAILSRHGLGRYDVENLRQRGYTPEQLMGFNYPASPEVRTNARANLIASRLSENGVHPEARSRADFTREALASQPVYHAPSDLSGLNLSGNYRVGPGQPITMTEIDDAIRNGILPEDFDFSQLRLATPESINSYYTHYPINGRDYNIRPSSTRPTVAEPRVVESTSPRTSASSSSITEPSAIEPLFLDNQWLTGSRSVFDDALQAEAGDLNRSLSTLSEEDFRTMAPVIKDRITALRDRVLSSGQTPSVDDARSMIKQELINLYRDKYNKLYKVELPNSTALWNSVHTRSYDSRPIFNSDEQALDAIFKDGTAIGNWNLSNPTIAATPYTAETVPLEFISEVDGSYWGDPFSFKRIVGSYSGFSAFGRKPEPLKRLLETLFGDTATHGRLAYEGNKSLDSTRLYNKQAAKAAREGKGALLFDGLKDIGRTDNKYNYVHTNDYAGTLYKPYTDQLGTLAELSTKKIADNVNAFSNVLKYTDPRVFRAFGGTPEIKAIIQRPGQSPQYIDLTYKAVKGADNKTNYVFDLLNTDAAGNHTSEAWKILDDFDQEMLRKKNAGESLEGYKLGMLHPLTGFRSFKHGGIIKRK